eukprot:scaffold4658_cov118-Cylindrotheca_fusiformis.AAC.13
MPSLSLHDCLSLGEIELGLSPERSEEDGEMKRLQEIQRLPLFLRILSLTRPLASISVFGTEDEEEDKSKEDALINLTVERLEHVAATYSVAEGVDVVTSHLAPIMSRKISRLPPLKRNADGVWDTTDLAEVARNPKSSKRKRSEADGSNEEDGEKDDNIHESSSDEEDDHKDETAEGEPSKKRPRHSLDRRDSEIALVEDSQEATFVKTLSELTSLVVAALAPLDTNNATENNDNAEEQAKQKISLTIDDSILNESGSSTGTGGAMEGSDLGSTVAAIMFNASVLQSRHVAYALCRAATPQAGELMTRLGANCPASIPSLLLGCLDAYTLAMQHSNVSITKASKQGVFALAKLSRSERARVLSKLQSMHLMLDVQLSLRLELPDETSAACFLLQHLSKEVVQTSKQLRIKNSKKTVSKQTAGDSSDDFRASHAVNSSSYQTAMTSLLADNMALHKATLSFFAATFSKLADADSLVVNGKLILLLKAYCWFLLVPTNKATPKYDPLQALSENAIPSLARFAIRLHDHCQEQMGQGEVPETSHFDGIMRLLRSATILTIARMAAEGVTNGKVTQASEHISQSLDQMRKMAPISKLSNEFGASIDTMCRGRNHLGFLTIIVSELTGQKNWERWNLQECLVSMENGLKVVFDSYDVDSPNMPEDVDLGIESTAATFLLEMQGEDKSSSPFNENKIAKLKATLQSILTDEKSAAALVRNNEVVKFIVVATAWLSTGGKMPVPHATSLQLEMLATKLTLDSAPESVSESESSFLLLLLHALEYLKQNSNSPFAIDPRALPIKKALNLSKCLSSETGSSFLLSRFEDYAASFCPEILVQAKTGWSLRQNGDGTGLLSVSRSEMMKLLHATIQSCMRDSQLNEPADRDGVGLEALFLEAKHKLTDADLCCTVVSSLLSSPHKPPPSFTYHGLCRDPLVVLKCPLKVWKCKGMRRVMLTILTSLMASNDAIVNSVARLEESAMEFLAARDALVVRCLLTAMSGSEANNSPPVAYCSMTTSIIRHIVFKRRGIVALLVKQGLPEKPLDWLVEFVPETMNDSQDMLQMLSDGRSLTPAERLVAADAVLRIAIVHGHSNEADAASMAYVSLSQLVDAFFLIAGPIGVPVNSMLVDESGLDVTQISRKAAFRILRSVRQVRGRRANLRKECGMALHKIAGLCKSESAVSGVGGAVAGRRQMVLKEIFDAVIKAANAMGSPVRNQSSAA